ncbi:RrF2 family transcriptional regulator [Lacrimispora algidixylanolytica]|uniref:Rrf2 family transcriptional regulator n=1 Tax=Lacrimispora algidixylanolytica TaxID=94868 RepID=A0A419T997_9FIRM|nr:Rrf2 family transcriptional regulator [Lacrimispora algidixylanolytica]RKD34036.1 Rrf2 family transcriptional regulator [Lacrimispora algidixylanolytica]
MKYTKATNYALHTVLYMIEQNQGEKFSVHVLAKQFQVSVTYLSKILTQLVKAGLVESVSGASGGYTLRKSIETISFMDIIQAIEGNGLLFECGIQQEKGCPIQKVMNDAEIIMEKYLQEKKLFELSSIKRNQK